MEKSRAPQRQSTTNSRAIYGLVGVNPQKTHGQPTGNLWATYGLSVRNPRAGNPWVTYGQHMGYPWTPNGVLTGIHKQPTDHVMSTHVFSRGVPMVLPPKPPWMPMGCPRVTHGRRATYKWTTHGLITGNSWTTDGQPTGDTQATHGKTAGYPWAIHGRHKNNPWGTHGKSTGYPWASHGSSTDNSRVTLGQPTGNLRTTH